VLHYNLNKTVITLEMVFLEGDTYCKLKVHFNSKPNLDLAMDHCNYK